MEGLLDSAWGLTGVYVMVYWSAGLLYSGDLLVSGGGGLFGEWERRENLW